jgi:transcriptional regulator with XRE-family HTH domain
MGTNVHDKEQEEGAVGTGVRAARIARGWKQLQLVRAIIAAADGAGLDVASHDSLLTYVSGWENGSRPVPVKYQRLLAEVLECDDAALFGADAGTAGRRSASTAPGRLDGMDIILSAAADTAQLIRNHSASNLHPATLEQMEADVRALALDFVTGDPMGVTLRAQSLRDEAFALLDARVWPDQARQLYLVAGLACGLLSVASSDFFGDTNSASTQCRAALLCADMADDDDLRTWIYELQSGVALWAGQWSRAAELAAEGRRFARTAQAAARAATAEARGLARLGDIEGVREAISASAKAQDTLPVGDSDVGVMGFSEANRLRCAGTALLWAGDHRAAESQLTAALDSYERDEPNAFVHLTVTRADLAGARLSGGDVDGAAEALAPVLDLDPGRRLAGAVRRAAAMARQLGRPEFSGRQSATQLAERLASFTAAGAR